MNTNTAPATILTAIALPSAVASLLALRGQIVNLTTNRQVKYLKTVTVAPTFKVSTFQCRAGVNYDNIAAVKEDRASGELPAENAGLNGVEWVAFPHLLRGIKSGKYQFRCTRLNGGNRTAVAFIRDGKEISREEAMAGTLASESREGEQPEVFNVCVDNITHINGIAV